MNPHHHTHRCRLHLTMLASLLALATCPWPATALAQDSQAMLAMAESAQRDGHHQAAVEILLSLQGRAPAAQLTGMLAISQLAQLDYRVAELAAIAALRDPSDAWVSTHRDVLMATLASASRHLGEVIVDGLPQGLPVVTHEFNLGLTGQRLRLAEGPRVVTVSLPDGRRLLLTVEVVAQQTITVDGSTASVIGAATSGPALPSGVAPTPFAAPAMQPASPAPTPFAAPAMQPASAAPYNTGGYAVTPMASPQPAYARPAPMAPTDAFPPAYATSGLMHAAPTAGSRPLFIERAEVPPAPVERAANRFGVALSVGRDFGLEYASQQSQVVDSSLETVEGVDNAAIVGGGHLLFQHDLGEHLVLATRLGFAYHKRHAASAWNLYGDRDFDFRLRVMDGHVLRFDLDQTARVVWGRRGAWLTSFVGLGGRVGVALFRHHGQNFWRAPSGDVYATSSSGTEPGYMAQAVLELGSYFGPKRTVEFAGTIGLGKPLLSFAFHLGFAFNGW